ncbi:betaine aldehyde dehydrogenase [Rhodococcus opacus PD630]|uniref:aldehyde dehydrogenase family protein n=1 Tax=Rhodococcus opacus TaxID=37919 RepID=UPI00029CBDC9|nr:aldehyde dehydrogenase family protein [Rhodococcus opacus]AHK36187.1 Putative aldehyde dehydrogenase dhaS [Rhodococcus opacus PD630]EHI43666.1 betaine aldehyde dehydrogenase [Rhodococcus opacus PD630]UDH01213.1 aldehyde dehydrogenase family protein [Rhodococcus opacus PD630]
MHYQMLIGGQWVDTDERYEVVNPATGALVATLARGEVKHVDAAVDAAARAYATSGWRERTMSERADLIDSVAAKLAERAEELALLAAQENGTPVRLAQGLAVGYPIAHMQRFATLARSYQWERSVEDEDSASGSILREPLGVVGGIVPWNFPLLLAVWKTIPAIATGNSVVLKIDEKTPIGTTILAETLMEAGLPDGVLNIVTGDGDSVGEHLAGHPRVRKISFTGSTATGRKVMSAASNNVKQITLELGGKGANIVLDDADLDLAVDGSLWAFLVHAGQACESGTRLLVHDSIHDNFVSRLVARARRLRIGDPTDLGTDLGPVINPRQRDRILGYIESAKEEGATLAFQGTLDGPAFERGNWVPPTIFTDVTNDMRIASEEIFGPVLSVIRYNDVDEAVELANDSEYGLSAGVWSGNEKRAREVAHRLEAGTVWINDWHNLSGALPFGGYKQSGFGRELGPDALDEFTNQKAISIDRSGREARTGWGLLFGELTSEFG